MPTLHIGSAVSEKTGMQVKGFSFIVMGILLNTRGPCPVIPGTNYSKERQNSGNRAACEPCPFYADSIGMLSLHIGPAVSEKNGP